MILPLLIALAAASPGAAHWRVAAVADDRVYYVFSGEYDRREHEVRFRMARALREPDARVLVWSDEIVSADCLTLEWTARDTWYDNGDPSGSGAARGRAGSGSPLAQVIRSACARTYQGGPILDRGSDAEGRLIPGR